MQTFDVSIGLISHLLHIFVAESADGELDWSESAVTATAEGSIGIALPSLEIGETYTVKVSIIDEFGAQTDTFFSHTIPVDESGFEVVDVVASSAPGVDGIVGRKFALPWVGMTTFQFSAPEGFVEDPEGNLVPKAAAIHVSPIGK